MKFSCLIPHKMAKKGQSLAEYGLILALVGIACVGALTSLQGRISAKLTTIGTCIGTGTGC